MVCRFFICLNGSLRHGGTTSEIPKIILLMNNLGAFVSLGAITSSICSLMHGGTMPVMRKIILLVNNLGAFVPP